MSDIPTEPEGGSHQYRLEYNMLLSAVVHEIDARHVKGREINTDAEFCLACHHDWPCADRQTLDKYTETVAQLRRNRSMR
ncbi:hypothetical protein SEA_PUPPER_69 [Gordonia phage Pupper]|uniref:Uncharacterized protein n=1 Tax=Gordonia phage Pupper TaxID=2571249 RepID=A0A4Y6EKI6_9CAUD|nr:hypothetical protein KHQ83_gp208 [Gordonia phage Pupper]QDF18555.1 hypothetical protein SEA_PUPPER_69 [Gordonia phage Pupper]